MNVIASSEGSLYELLCRGKKDTYFYEDSPKSVNLFDTSYNQEEQIMRDVRRIPPTTGIDFGKMIEFPIDIIGDVLESVSIVITLPTWFPASVARSAHTMQISDPSGNTFGYVNGIAYFLFESIQVYQDTTILQQFSGDYLWAASKIKGTYSDRFTTAEETGSHDGSVLSIGRNALPGTLRLRLPMIGTCAGDKGFPLVSTTAHIYKIKCRLRKLEDLVECSAPSGQKPSPWQTLLQSTTLSGVSTFTSLAKDAMAPLRVELETQHLFLTNTSKDALRTTSTETPFISVYENKYTQTSTEAASVGINRRIDACHPSERMIWFFRTMADIEANRLWKVSQSYANLGLTIAGRSREANWPPSIWRDVTNFAKEEIDSGTEINTMNWGIGCVAPKKYEFKQADGTLNFTTADRPTIYAALQGGISTELRVFVEGWGSFITDEGRAEVLSFN